MKNPEAKHVLIESLAFENANLECRKTLGPLKVRSAPIDEWIFLFLFFVQLFFAADLTLST